MTKKLEDKIYYNGHDLLTRNALFNFILGARSTGKSFWFKLHFLLKKNTFVAWIRRSNEDIEQTWKNWLVDLRNADKLPKNVNFEATQTGIFVDGVLKVAFIALSTASNRQSIVYELARSDDDINENPEDKPNKVVVFEEFVSPSGRYLKDEINLFLNLYVTIKRLDRVPVYFIGNKVSWVNPYFEYFRILPFTEEFKWFQNKTILVQNYDNQAFKEHLEEDEFFKLVKGTNYGNYLYNNDVWKDTNAYIAKLPENSRQICNIRFDNSEFGLWESKDYNYYISWKTNPTMITYSTMRDRNTGDYLINAGRYSLMNNIKDMIKYNKIYFENNTLKEKIFNLVNGGCN